MLAREEFNKAVKIPGTWELGRLKLFGFAFDVKYRYSGNTARPCSVSSGQINASYFSPVDSSGLAIF